MNRIQTAALAALFAVLISGCATHSVPRFHEASHANAVLQFSSWEYTFLLRPSYDDNGFLLQVPRDHVADVFRSVNLEKRDLAVVIVGWNRSPDELRQLTADWNGILRGNCGFNRVVVVKSTGHKDINGSVIIDDSAWPNSITRTAPLPAEGQHASAFVAPAARTDVANSSGNSVGQVSQRVVTR